MWVLPFVPVHASPKTPKTHRMVCRHLIDNLPCCCGFDELPNA